jgi:hypothetical protein
MGSERLSMYAWADCDHFKLGVNQIMSEPANPWGADEISAEIAKMIAEGILTRDGDGRVRIATAAELSFEPDRSSTSVSATGSDLATPGTAGSAAFDQLVSTSGQSVTPQVETEPQNERSAPAPGVCCEPTTDLDSQSAEE